MERGVWWATVHRVTESQTRLKPLSMHACKYYSFYKLRVVAVLCQAGFSAPFFKQPLFNLCLCVPF